MENIRVIVETKEKYCITDSYYTIMVNLLQLEEGYEVNIYYFKGDNPKFLEMISHFDKSSTKMGDLFRESKEKAYKELSLLPHVITLEELAEYINSDNYDPFILERIISLNRWENEAYIGNLREKGFIS